MVELFFRSINNYNEVARCSPIITILSIAILTELRSSCGFPATAWSLIVVFPTPRALRLFRPLPEQTAADLIEAGIRQAWSGVYRLNLTGPEDEFLVFVQVVIHRDRRRRPVRICLKRLLIRPAHVISPVWRRIWGVFKTGQLESMGTNWAPTHPGKMILPIGLSPVTLRQIAAHEAGHLFGLGDAYGAVYRFYHGVQGKERYMMYSNQEVHPEEIVMLLNAHQTGRMQFFPRSWNTTRFVQGLRTDIAIDHATGAATAA